MKQRATFSSASIRSTDAEPDAELATIAEETDDALVADFRERLLSEIDLAELSKLDLPQRRARLERVMTHLVASHGPLLSSRERTGLIRRVVAEALGLGVLEPLLADDAVTEIMVNGPDTIYIERLGRVELADERFVSNEQLLQTIDRIVSTVNRRVDESSPMVDARLRTGERVNVILPPLALDGPVVTIRKFPRPFTMQQLVNAGTLDEHTAHLLAAAVRAKLNIIVSGGTGSGKTTLLNSLSSFIPDSERIVTIEDAAELSLQQGHVIRLESRPANVEGKGMVSIRDLVRNSLRMRPDRIVVGEVRGGETMDMLSAMNTGHEGSLTTIHANSPEEALSRAETLASMSDLDLPFAAVQEQVNNAIDLIVQLDRGPDGSRRVVDVALVASKGRETYRLERLSTFESAPIGADRVVRGRHVAHTLPPLFVRRLELAGEQVTSVPPAPAAGSADFWGVMTLVVLALLITLAVVLFGLYQFWIDLGERSMYLKAAQTTDRSSDTMITRSPVDSWVLRTRYGDSIQSTLTLLGWSMRPSTFALAVIGFCLFLGMLVGALFSWLLLPIGFWVGTYLVRTRVRSLREKRKEDFIAQMPELARVLSNASSAGLSIRTAVAMAADELEEPAHTELRIVTDQINVGVPLETALSRMEDRLPSRELGILVSSLVVSARSGGALVSALRDIAETLETRKEVRREIRTTYAQTVATAYSVLSFGLVALLLLESLNPGTVDKMLRNPFGQAALIGSAAVYAAGIWVVRKMTTVET